MAESSHLKPRNPLLTHLPKILVGLAGVALLAGGTYWAMRKTPQDHFRAGVAMHQRGDLKGAAIELKNTLQAAPENAEARYLLGRIHFANGDYQAAEKELKKARGLGIKDGGLDPLFARTVLMLNQPQRVLDEVKDSSSEEADSKAAVLALRARAHLMLKNSAAAEKDLADAQLLVADHPEVLATRAMLAMTRNNLDESLALTDQALAKATQRADLWVMKGDLLRRSKRNEEALAAYGKALAGEPANIPARVASAQLHLGENALDKAEAELKELHKYAPNNVMGRYLEAYLEFRHAHFAEADGKLQDVLRSAPDFLPGRLLAGVVSLAQGNREGAKSHLNKVLEAAPQHPLARKLMAATLADLGEFGSAKDILGSFDDAGSDPVLHSLRGEIALRQGDYTEARKQLEKMEGDLSQSPKYFAELAASRMGSGDEAGAIQALTKAAELDTISTKPDALLVSTYLKEKRFDEAFKVVDKLAKERPNDPLVENLRGSIHLSRNDKAQARAHFAKALQIDPGYFPAASNLALLDMMDKDIKAARSRFEQFLKQTPGESRAWLALASLDARDKNQAGYLKNLNQAKRTDSKNAQAHLMLTRYWLDKKDAAKALLAAREALDATGRPEFLEFVGLAQVMQNDNVNALSSFKRWAEIRPNNPLAHFRLAQAQIADNDKATGLSELDKALALRPDFTDASISKALLLSQMGRSADAIKISRSLQASAPKAAAGYLTEAEILFADKKYLEAGRLFAKAAQIAGHGQSLGRAYQAYVAGGQAAEGEKILGQWLTDHTNDVAVRHVLAQGQLNSKRWKASAENYRTLIRANPRDLTAYNNLAWALGELKDSEATVVAEQAIRLAPNDAAVQDTYGWLLTGAGQAEKGLPYLRQALKSRPDAAEIRWHLAATLAKTGDTRGAEVELDRLLASRVVFPQEPDARALLQKLRASAR